jgi:hypothetical protein
VLFRGEGGVEVPLCRPSSAHPLGSVAIGFLCTVSGVGRESVSPSPVNQFDVSTHSELMIASCWVTTGCPSFSRRSIPPTAFQRIPSHPHPSQRPHRIRRGKESLTVRDRQRQGGLIAATAQSSNQPTDRLRGGLWRLSIPGVRNWVVMVLFRAKAG